MAKPKRRRVNGEGSITQRPDGLYHGRVYVTTTSGTRKRVSVYGRTWEEAHKKVTALKSAEDQGIPLPDTDVTVGDYLTFWLAEHVLSRRRPKTYQGYESVVRVHLMPGLGRKKLRDLRARDVRTWLNRVRTDCQCCRHGWDAHRDTSQCCAVGRCCDSRLSARMVQSIHAVLRNALEQAVRDELILRNVAKLVQVPSPRYAVGKGLTVAQARLLLKYAADDRLHTLYVLALLLGLRRGELLGLRWDAIDVEARTLTVSLNLQRVGGTLRLVPPKTESSVRTVPLPGLVVAALTAHREQQATERAAAGERWTETGMVFTTRTGTLIEPDNLRRSWYPLRRRLGVELRFHDLRHTCVSLLLDLGVPPHVVQEIAGHSDIGVTMTIYAHAAMDEKRKALDRLNGELG